VDELALSDRSPSELRTQLQIGSNLLAHHLDTLEGAGLVERLGSSGDRRRKYLRLVPDGLAAIWSPVEIVSARRLLFVCTANSARSQLAAALWNDRHEVPAESAGTKPARASTPRPRGRANGPRPHLARPSLDVVGEPDCDHRPRPCARAPRQPRREESPALVDPDPADGGGPSAPDDALLRSPRGSSRSLRGWLDPRPPAHALGRAEERARELAKGRAKGRGGHAHERHRSARVRSARYPLAHTRSRRSPADGRSTPAQAKDKLAGVGNGRNKLILS
jgi:DNA-binding transcriptional ArsR family regulator